LAEKSKYENILQSIKDDLGIKQKSKPMLEVTGFKAVYTKKEKEKELMFGIFKKYIDNYTFFEYCDYYKLEPEKTAFDFVVNRKYRIEGCQIGINLTTYKPYVLFLVDLKNGKVIANKMAETEEWI